MRRLLSSLLLALFLVASFATAGQCEDKQARKLMIHRYLLDLALQSHHWQDATAEYKSCISLEPMDPKLHFDYGYFLWKTMGTPKNALPELQQAVRYDSKNEYYRRLRDYVQWELNAAAPLRATPKPVEKNPTIDEDDDAD